MIFLYLLLCLLFAGFFAGLETGLLAVNRFTIQHKSNNGILHARAVEFLLVKPERLLGTTLIGHNIANVTAAVLLTNFFETRGLSAYTWLGIIAMTFVFLVFDDFLPKSFFRLHANTIAAKLGPALLVFYAIFFPISLILNTLVKALLYLTGGHRARREELRTKRDLRFLVNLTGKEAGLATEDRRIIEDILHFRDQTAGEVMIPFHKLPVLSISQNTADAVRVSVETGFRFLAISQNRTDNMVGFVDVMELLWTDKKKISEIIKSAIFYPETKRIPDLLMDMNRSNQKVVFLVDEYGGIAGMITPNQIVADIVRYSPEDGTINEDIQRVEGGRFIVDGETDLENLGSETGVTLSGSLNRTIGGYISEKLGMIPEVDTEYHESGYSFRVLKRDDRRIASLEIRRQRNAESGKE